MYTDNHEMGGVFDIFGKVLTGAGNVAGQVVQGKQLYDATKVAWKGTPFPAAPGATQGIPQVFLPQAQGAPQSAQSPNRGLTKAEIADLQARLNAMGYNTGAVDGVYGPNTRNGILAYQSANGLVADGGATLHLLQRVQGFGAQSPQQIFQSPTNQIPPYVVQYPQQPPLRDGPSAQLPGGNFAIAGLPQWAIPAGLAGLAILLLSQSRGR